MKNVLGIGTAGCNIVEQLSKYNVYTPYYMSNIYKRSTKNKFAVPYEDSPEKYETRELPKLEAWLEKLKNNCTVFLCGASDSSALVLRVLEILHRNKNKIEVVCFVPEVEVLSETKALHERTVRGVLQNYARSGLLSKMTLISNYLLEKSATNTNVYDYYKQINEVFVGTYYMMDVFKNTAPVISTHKKPNEVCRISTIGISSLGESEDTLFFPIKNDREVVYYYGINETKLREHENLFRSITEKVKTKITESRKVSFGVYSTQYEEDYIYAESFSSEIQE